MSVVRTRRPTPPLQLLKNRVDMIVKEQDEMKASVKSELQDIQDNIAYIMGKLDDLIEIYREHFHSKSSTNTDK